MAMDSDLLYVYERMSVCKLLYGVFMVCKRIVAHVSVTIVVVPFRAARMASSLSYGDHDEARLSKTVGTYVHACERIINRLDLRARIHVINYRINLCGIEIERLVHDAVKIRDAVSRLYRKEFREPVSVGEKLREVAFLKIHDLVSLIIKDYSHRDGIDA